MKRYYNVNGLRLLIETGDDDLAAALHQYFAPFTANDGGDQPFTATLEHAPLDPIPVATHLDFDGEILPGISARLHRLDQSRWLVVPDQLVVHLDRARRRAMIQVTSQCSRMLLGHASIHVIDAALASSGQHLLHAAALALPGDRQQSLLLFAPSGRGKTTTALALALGGFALMTDDATVLQPRGMGGRSAACAWGLPRALKVHHNTARMLPAIAPLLGSQWDEFGEQVLPAATLARVAPVLPARPLPIAAIAILGERTSSDHVLEVCSKAKVLAMLAQDNLARSPGGVLPEQVARFDGMAALIEATPVMELRVGSQLPTLAAYVAGVLK